MITARGWVPWACLGLACARVRARGARCTLDEAGADQAHDQDHREGVEVGRWTFAVAPPQSAWLSEADARTRTGDPIITSEVQGVGARLARSAVNGRGMA